MHLGARRLPVSEADDLEVESAGGDDIGRPALEGEEVLGQVAGRGDAEAPTRARC
jgi:hypothetical protein